MDTVLVLHTHPIYRSGVKLLLLYEMDINVLEAGSGQEALALLRKYAVDLVVMDSALQDMEGYETIQWIKATRPNLPILVLTSSADDIDSDLHKMAEFILPNYTRQTFAHAVRAMLQAANFVKLLKE